MWVTSIGTKLRSQLVHMFKFMRTIVLTNPNPDILPFWFSNFYFIFLILVYLYPLWFLYPIHLVGYFGYGSEHKLWKWFFPVLMLPVLSYLQFQRIDWSICPGDIWGVWLQHLLFLLLTILPFFKHLSHVRELRQFLKRFSALAQRLYFQVLFQQFRSGPHCFKQYGQRLVCIWHSCYECQSSS